MVVSIGTGPFGPGPVPVCLTYMCVSPPYIVVVRPVLGVSNRMVIPPVRMAVNHAVTKGRSYEKPVEGPVGVYPVIRIDVSDMIIVIAHRGIVNAHPTKSIDPAVAIGDLHIPNLVHPPVEVVVNGYMLHLYHRSVVIVLHEGVVIIT